MNPGVKKIPVAVSLTGLDKSRQSAGKSGPVNKRIVYLAIQAMVNAVVVGVVARLLVYLIDAITSLAFYGKLSFAPASPAGNHLGVLVVLVPVLGSIVVGLMARYGSTAIRGHGIPEAMEKIITGNSRIPLVVTFLKPLSAAVSIGTGGPFGAEGPIIATGGAFGSYTGQIMHISAAERKIMLAAGSCAGMSAIFGSPLAAVLLAIELLLFEFSPRSIIPVALACVTGAGMHLLLFGNTPVFAMPVIPVPGNSALVLYTVMGVVIGVVASLVSKSVYAVEDLFEKLPIHWMWWPAIGAVAVGVTGYFAPYTMGVGYENIQHLLAGNLPLVMLLSLCVLKYLSWVIALGSGTSGGTLAPLFTIGGALGALLGVGVIQLFPGAGVNIATAALIGMAAMFAGASRALLTAIVFALETTGQSNGLLPLLAACVAAYFVSFFLMDGTIMTEKIKRRGVKTPAVYIPDLLQLSTVQQLMEPVAAMPPVNAVYVWSTDDLSTAAALMGSHGLDVVWVADAAKQQVTGTISSAAILAYYSQALRQEQQYESPRRTRRWMVTGRRLWQRNRELRTPTIVH